MAAGARTGPPPSRIPGSGLRRENPAVRAGTVATVTGVKTRLPAFWWACGSAAALIAGCLGTWAVTTEGIFSRDWPGTTSGGDGVWLIGAAVISAGCLVAWAASAGWKWGWLIPVIALGSLSLLTVIADGSAISGGDFVQTGSGDGVPSSAGWGLYVSGLGALSLAAAAVTLLAASIRAGTSPVASAPGAAPAVPLPAPGWYPDPSNPAGPARWWDGTQWGGQAAPPPPPPPPPPPAS